MVAVSGESLGVVVTGMGAMTPVGGTLPETWEGLLAGRSGVVALDEEWAGALPVKIAGRVTEDPAAHLSMREFRRMDRCGQLALIAAREAWAQAGTPEGDPERLAVVIGSGYGGLGTTLAQARVLDNAGSRRVSPHTLTQIMVNGPQPGSRSTSAPAAGPGLPSAPAPPGPRQLFRQPR